MAQKMYPGSPVFKPATDTFEVPEINISVENLLEIKKQEAGAGFKDNEFGIEVPLDINPENYGVWREVPSINKRIWLLAINVPQAKSVHLILSPFNLLPGAKLFFYDSLQTQVLGAITFLNNKPSDILPLSQINSKKIYCELQLPSYATGFGYFTISKAGVEPYCAKSLKSVADKWYGTSQPCHINVNCIRTPAVQLQKNAVCRIVYRGTRRCTGTLVNNIENDQTPYVLTAAHCINSEYVANTAVFYFNFESPSCENIEGPAHTLSGASLVAAGYYGSITDTLDFALLKLNEPPPMDFLPYFSGWDATGITPDSTYVIHHPNGDIKKISTDTDFPFTSDAGYGFDNNTHWLVSNYTQGSTEDGSSGSGLVSSKNRLIGTLSTGGVACTPDIFDFYQKLAHAYNDYADARYQLKKWLDPQSTGLLVCDGFDAAGALRESAQELQNFTEPANLNELKHVDNWGYVSGHNYKFENAFAEQINIKGSKYIYGAYVTPQVSYSNSFGQMVTFTVWEGGNIPGAVIYEEQIPINQIDAGMPFYIDFDSTLLISNNFFFGYQINYNTDTFAVYTIPALQNKNTAFARHNGIWQPLRADGQTISANLAIKVLAFDLMPQKGVITDTSTWDDVYIYPNPARHQLQIYLKNYENETVSVKMFDVCGRFIKHENIEQNGPNIPFEPNVEKGIYFLQIKRGNEKPVIQKVLIE
ncbi:MAG: T9SS type A sorting domain-containing protein [Bacteroidales bacterium]|nr:T9SS type A sorting domain-containing protein [Bacteroidales bacterium]